MDFSVHGSRTGGSRIQSDGQLLLPRYLVPPIESPLLAENPSHSFIAKLPIIVYDAREGTKGRPFSRRGRISCDGTDRHSSAARAAASSPALRTRCSASCRPRVPAKLAVCQSVRDSSVALDLMQLTRCRSVSRAARDRVVQWIAWSPWRSGYEGKL